jgi:internalin A
VNEDSKAEIFDVFLCHNSEDKTAVRDIARQLAEKGIRPWLDEEQIRPGTPWQTALGQQIEGIKSAAVFVGESGLGPWQNEEIQALLSEFIRRGCLVIPVILASAPVKVVLPWSLASLHCVDFRATDSYPLKRLIWAITGEKPAELSHVLPSEKPATMRDAVRGRLLPSEGDHAVPSKRYYPPLAKSPAREQATQLEILRRRVVEYVEGILRRSLHHEVLLSLGKRPIDEAVDAPWKYTAEAPDAADPVRLDDRDISAIYDATGLLLILGEPGLGKTTTLLDLARTLLERARDDLKERVPVVLDLSSWKRKQPLAGWISGELSEKYRVPRKIASFWLERDYLVPLLDGLNEVETRIQPDCVAAINAFIEQSNPSGLVVCCRLPEYQWLPERLKLNRAICLEPLSPEGVSKYLDQGGPKLAALRKALNSDPVLQELAQTPLMLNIMSLVGQGTSGNELAGRKGGSAAGYLKQIFGLYVEQMLQRIRKAKANRATALDLSHLNYVTQLPRELERLTSLQKLNLSGCVQLSDLRPLARLSSLQTLNLSGCERLSDLGPLAKLNSLQTLHLFGCAQLNDLTPLAALSSLRTLHLSGCRSLRQFGPLESLLPTLKVISLSGCKFNDLPAELCGEPGENVLAKVRAHYEDLKAGQQPNAEIKVLFLGNGSTGKTQLCRRLRGERFDPTVPTTHAIQLSDKTLPLEGFDGPVRLNLWDFGGQEIYHGSHALFLQGQAVFLILWTPQLEQGCDCEGGLTFRRRPLAYWLDYLRAFAGSQNSTLIVQSRCDTPRDRVSHPPATTDDLAFFRKVETSALTGLGLGLLRETLKEAVRDCFDRRPPPPIGAGRFRVRDRLRRLLAEDQKLPAEQRQYRLLERREFDRLCDEAGGISDKGALLDFLHDSGVIFYQTELLGDYIVLDQNWALEAIYALFDRKKTLPRLRDHGRFTRADLQTLIWSSYSFEEQTVFLAMMESCGICFPARELPNGEWEYIALELLPGWSDAQEQLLGRLREDPPAAEAEARYAFLHEGILRGYLSKIGRYAKDAPVYWKYGCWFYEETTKSQALIESRWEDSKTETGPGMIRFRAWGERAQQLIEPLVAELQRLPVGQAPQISWPGDDAAHGPSSRIGNVDGTPETGLNDLDIPDRHEPLDKSQPEVFVSFAWGDDSSEQARQRTEVVDRLCQRLAQEGWKVLRDSGVMRPGELISGFMKRIGRADRVIVVLSDKYLHSPCCMTELHSIYQRSLGEKEDFLRRIVPLTLADAQLDDFKHRDAYAEQWMMQFRTMDEHLCRLAMEQKLSRVALDDFRRYKEMQKWYLDVSDMLAHVNDVLHPHGFEAIVKDDFAVLRQMLQQAAPERRS